MKVKALSVLLMAMSVLLAVGAANGGTVVDGLGRKVSVPDKVGRVLCSGPGCLRLLTYLQAQNLAVATDETERRGLAMETRPYALAYPELKNLPLAGEGMGRDNPELISTLASRPQVIFKTFPGMGMDGALLQAKTGIPVLVLNYGNLTYGRDQLDASLRLMGQVLGRTDRANKVIAYLDGLRDDLTKRTRDIPESKRPLCYVGGISMRGGHGFQSTDPAYAPFAFLNVRNAAAKSGPVGQDISHASVAKEQIVAWNPDIVILDLGTTALEGAASGLHELRTEPVYRKLKAVREGRVYGMLPCNSYAQNYESVMANAYAAGKTIYPERFKDVDPAAKADEILGFMVGKPVFATLRTAFREQVFTPLEMR